MFAFLRSVLTQVLTPRRKHTDMFFIVYSLCLLISPRRQGTVYKRCSSFSDVTCITTTKMDVSGVTVSNVEQSEAESAPTRSSVGLRLGRVCSNAGEEGIGTLSVPNQDVSVTDWNYSHDALHSPRSLPWFQPHQTHTLSQPSANECLYETIEHLTLTI